MKIALEAKNRYVGLWRLMSGYHLVYIGAVVSLGIAAVIRSGTYLLLGYGADLEAQIPLGTAESAAAGWGGDAFQVYARDSDDARLMAAHWVWDTNGDASTFARAMKTHLAGRFRGGDLDTLAGDCWSSNAQLTCLFTSGRQTLWLLAPDDFTLQAIRKLYPAFG